jgi:hypothetical protein
VAGVTPGIALLALTAVSTGVSIVQARKSAKDADEARQIQQKSADLQNQRRIRQSVERARIARAQVLASGQSQTGGFGSSGIQGGISSAQAQLGSSIGFANTLNAANTASNDALRKSNKAAANSALAGSIAQLPSQFGFNAEKAAQKIFAKPGGQQGSAALGKLIT